MISSAAPRVGCSICASARTTSTGLFCARTRVSTSYVFGSTASAVAAAAISPSATPVKRNGRRRTEPSANSA
jgi:hypothetical protein